ncbi:MAG: LysM peptidoglycan-binding domain-containing protein [Novosphingobium sp.]|nr:LysM peptidoglycan-binding domain-containing protein [Novosphingobium sp.]
MLAAGAALLLAPATLSALPANQESEHVVEAGETLNGIANRAEVARDQIIEANALEPPYVVRIGQKLKIPRAPSSEGKAAQRTIAARPEDSSLASASSYVVQPGDTLGSIAIRAEIPRVLIAEANGLSSQDAIRVGQKLTLPRTQRHTVATGETGFDISYKYAVPWEQIAIANGMDANASLPVGKVLLIPTIIDAPRQSTPVAAAPAVAAPAPKPAADRFAWPLAGPIRRGFTPRSASDHHDGIDITAKRGEAVRAIAPGKVIYAQKDPDQFGNLVVVDHGDGWHSAYGSLQKITVKNGEDVFKGERVGLVGDTSITRLTELHFEMRKGGKPVDPMDYLPRQP